MSKALKDQARMDDWRSKVSAWQSSGQSQQAFCRAQGLNYAQFVYWRRKFERGTSPASPGSAKSLSGFVGVVPSMAMGRETETGLSLVLPNGVELRGIAMSNVEMALRLLGRLS